MGALHSNPDSNADSDDSVTEARMAATDLVQSLASTPVFALALRGDILRVVNADARTLLVLQEACARAWTQGIRDVTSNVQSDGDYGLVVDVQLHTDPKSRGKLFGHSWRPLLERVQLLRLMCTLQAALYQLGWRLLAAPCLDYGSNLSTFLFELTTCVGMHSNSTAGTPK